MAKKVNIRNRIKEIAKASFINATDDFCERVEEEIEKGITSELLERVRISMIKTPTPEKPPEKTPDNTAPAKPEKTK